MKSLSEQERWLKLNDRLVNVGNTLINKMERMIDKRPDCRILLSFLEKSTNTLKATQLLVKERLFEQAQIMARTIFELRVTFDCFINMLQKDPREACRRVNDAMLLEKIKQIESVDFQSEAPKEFQINRKKWQLLKEEIRQRHTKDEIKAMRKYGFTGLSVEQRCRQTKHAQVYNIVYRNFSRNVHSTDFMEHVGKSLLKGQEFNDYLTSRNIATLYTSHISAVGVNGFISLMLDRLMGDELKSINKEQAELKYQKKLARAVL